MPDKPFPQSATFANHAATHFLATTLSVAPSASVAVVTPER
jgi:hypothetical protein